MNRQAVILVVVLALPGSISCTGKEAVSTETSSTVSSSSTTAGAAASVPAVTTTPSAPSTETAVATSSVAPAASAAIATSDGEKSGVSVEVHELKRGSGGTVSLKFTIINHSDASVGGGYDFGDPDHHIGDFGTIGGVQLIDPVGKKKYFVARDSDEKCVCSNGIKDVAVGASSNYWAKFPAPPDDVQKITVVIPHFAPMDDVPISR